MLRPQLESRGYTVSLEALKPYGQDKLPQGTASHALAEAARVGPIWALVILYFTSFGGFIALTGWLPQLLARFLSHNTDDRRGTDSSVFCGHIPCACSERSHG